MSAPRLESVSLPFMEVLYEAGETLGHVYFSDDGLISLLVVMEDETVREIGIIGKEGVFGIELALGVKTSPLRALVQLPGTARRMKAAALLEEFNRGGAHAVNERLARLVRDETRGGVNTDE